MKTLISWVKLIDNKWETE